MESILCKIETRNQIKQLEYENYFYIIFIFENSKHCET